MIFVTLPAYNEGDGIAVLLRNIDATAEEFLPGLKFTVVVVDDGSTDSTAQATQAEIERLQQADDDRISVVMIQHEVNRGLAEAVKTGLLYCADKVGPRDVILTMDSDNSHTPGLIPHLVRLVYEGYDVVIASRFRPGARVLGLSLHRRFLSVAASLVLRTLFPIPGVRDYTCGYRAYRGLLVADVMRKNESFISESGFTVMVDILLKLRREPTILMTEVPLLLRYDYKVSTSKMNVPKTIRQTLNLIARRLAGQP